MLNALTLFGGWVMRHAGGSEGSEAGLLGGDDDGDGDLDRPDWRPRSTGGDIASGSP